jgi:hypothetical protein
VLLCLPKISLNESINIPQVLQDCSVLTQSGILRKMSSEPFNAPKKGRMQRQFIGATNKITGVVHNERSEEDVVK